MKSITYRYRRADGAIVEKIGYPTLTRGLYVSLSSEGRGWVVAHVRSGAYLGYTFDDPEAALAVANQLGGLADWTGTIEELRAEPSLFDRVAGASVAGGGVRLHGVAFEDCEALDNGVPA